MARRWCAVAVLALAAVTGLAQALDDKEVKPEGTYSFVSFVHDGKKMPMDELKDFRLILTETNYTVKKGEEVMEEGTYKLDTSKKPHLLTRTATAGEHKGKTFLGICQPMDERMQVCWGPPNGDRPTEFTSKPGSGHVLEVIEKMSK